MNLLMHLKYFLLIPVFVSGLGACSTGQIVKGHPRAEGAILPFAESSYKVYKIKSLKNIYLIYACRNDSIFEIVSRKEKQEMCKNVKVNSLYNFELRSRFGDKSSPLYIPRSNRLLVTHSNFYGTLVPLEDKARGDLYTANNLQGLCFKVPR